MNDPARAKVSNLLIIGLLTVLAVMIVISVSREEDDDNVHRVRHLPKRVPFPPVFSSSPGLGIKTPGYEKEKKKDKSKPFPQELFIALNDFPVPEQAREKNLTCIGTVRVQGKTYYLLEWSGVWFVEPDERVEPILTAIYQHHVNDSDARPPRSIKKLVSLLPDDPTLLDELATQVAGTLNTVEPQRKNQGDRN